MNYHEELGKLQTEAERRLSELGDRYYREVIVPLCRKYNLRFISGMGSYFFGANAGKYSLGFDVHIGEDRLPHLVGEIEEWIAYNDTADAAYLDTVKALVNDLTAAYEVLTTPVNGDKHAFGMYLNDYDSRAKRDRTVRRVRK